MVDRQKEKYYFTFIMHYIEQYWSVFLFNLSHFNFFIQKMKTHHKLHFSDEFLSERGDAISVWRDARYEALSQESACLRW